MEKEATTDAFRDGDDVRDMVSSEALMQHVETIAQWVRLSGDEDEAKAFDYIESKLKEWGIAYRRESHPAYISLPGDASLELSTPQKDIHVSCITHSMGATTPSPGVSAQVVDVGQGTIEEYQQAGFKPGQIALVSGLAAPAKAAVAAKLGAAGAIFVNGDELHEMIISPVWGSPSTETLEMVPNLPVVSILGEDGREIRRCLTKEVVRATLRTEVLTEWRPIPLIVAEVEGNTYPDEVVLLAGHVDSWHYGAMDNASANAVQLEALRAFQQRKERLVRTLRVAFWSGHSHGRYAGSTWYVDHHYAELEERLVVQMYVDSVGGEGATVLSEAWAMSETKDVAQRALRLETGEQFNGSRFGRGGDQSFYGIGVSGLFMCLSEQPPVSPESSSDTVSVSQLLGGNGNTGGLGWWWHNEADTPDKICPEYLLRDARIYLYALSQYLEYSLLDLDFRPTIGELRAHLSDWQKQAGDDFSLAAALEACDDLENEVNGLYNLATCDTLDDHSFNRAVVGLSRRLVPLNYSTGNRFEHDVALTLPPIPALSPISDLTATPAQSAARQHLLVLLQRRLNHVTQTLIEATRWVKMCVSSRGGAETELGRENESVSDT